jgi:hypothetical protein
MRPGEALIRVAGLNDSEIRFAASDIDGAAGPQQGHLHARPTGIEKSL